MLRFFIQHICDKQLLLQCNSKVISLQCAVLYKLQQSGPMVEINRDGTGNIVGRPFSDLKNFQFFGFTMSTSMA